jgi:hypothetical protein
LVLSIRVLWRHGLSIVFFLAIVNKQAKGARRRKPAQAAAPRLLSHVKKSWDKIRLENVLDREIDFSS